MFFNESYFNKKKRQQQQQHVHPLSEDEWAQTKGHKKRFIFEYGIIHHPFDRLLIVSVEQIIEYNRIQFLRNSHDE